MTSNIVSENEQSTAMEYLHLLVQDLQCVCWKAERWPCMVGEEANIHT
jgi:hypothetical protein